jgi:hypothetical protein
MTFNRDKAVMAHRVESITTVYDDRRGEASISVTLYCVCRSSGYIIHGYSVREVVNQHLDHVALRVRQAGMTYYTADGSPVREPPTTQEAETG